jgi:hypothetical protein
VKVLFESVPAGADCYVLSHVIHDWDDEPSPSLRSSGERLIRRREDVTGEFGA